MKKGRADVQREVARREAFEYHRANPLDVTTFATSRIGLGMPRLYRKQQEFLEALFPPPSDIADPITNPAYDEGVALWGKGSGKDTVAVLGQAYTVYRLLLHDDPRAWLGVPIGDTVDLVNVASNSDQAQTIFFERAKARITRSPFFHLFPTFKPFPAPKGDIASDSIEFPHQIFARSLHAQSDGVEGYNTFLGVMDEADAFVDKSKRRNAPAMLKALSSSIGTRYKKTKVGTQGVVIVLSWPRHAESFTIKEYTRSVPPRSGEERDMPHDQRVYGSRAATWEVRDDLKREDFEDDYKRDPQDAAAKLETLPPATEDAFFSLPHKVDAAFRGENVILWSPRVIEREVRGERKLFMGVDIHDVTPRTGAAYWIHCDAGLRKDSYALAMARADGDNRIVEAILLWEPRPGVPVDFLNVRQTILDIAANFTVAGVSFDQWNSAEAIQGLQAHNIRAEEYTFTQPYTLRIYQHLKTVAYGDRLILPREGPGIEKLRRELKRLQLLRGVKVDHPEGECFTGDTRVALLDGSLPTFEELSARYADGTPFHVYTMTPQGPTVGVARNPRITKRNVPIVEVAFDNHHVIRCTPDHPFMTINGDYVRAADLTREVSLMPLYRYRGQRGGWADYERITNPITGEREYTHHMVARWKYGARLAEHHIHHDDENKGNNDPSNLLMEPKSTHLRNHTLKRHETNAEYVRAIRAGHQKYRENGGNEKSRENMLRLFEEGVLKRGRPPCSIIGCPTLSEAKGLCGRHYQEMRRGKMREHGVANHRILYVRECGTADVWDITVEKTENFLLAAGVFVHNSKDIADSVAVSVFNARNAIDVPPVDQVATTQPDVIREMGGGGFNDALLKPGW